MTRPTHVSRRARSHADHAQSRFVLHAQPCSSLRRAVALFAQQAPDRSHPPQPGRRRRCKLPAIQKRQLSNGLPVWIVELHEVPVAQVNLVVLERQRRRSAGQVRRRQPGRGDARGRRRLAVGARDRRRRRLPRRRSRRGDGVRLCRRSGCTCRSRGSPTRCRSWPTSRCGRRSRKTSSSGCASSGSPACSRRATIRRRLSSVAFSRVLYGKGHRYGTPQMGTAETIKAFTRRRSARLLRVRVPARQRDAARRRRRHAPTRCCRCSRRTSAHGRRRAAAARREAAGDRRAAGAPGLSGRQAGRAAVADPHRLRSACRVRRPTTSRFRC